MRWYAYNSYKASFVAWLRIHSFFCVCGDACSYILYNIVFFFTLLMNYIKSHLAYLMVRISGLRVNNKWMVHWYVDAPGAGNNFRMLSWVWDHLLIYYFIITLLFSLLYYYYLGVVGVWCGKRGNPGYKPLRSFLAR